LIELMVIQGVALTDVAPQAYLIHAGEKAAARVTALAESLRDALPGLRLRVHAGPGGFKAQLRRADRSGAALALVFGDDEAANDAIQIKPLTTDQAQERVPLARAPAYIAQLLAGTDQDSQSQMKTIQS